MRPFNESYVCLLYSMKGSKQLIVLQFEQVSSFDHPRCDARTLNKRAVSLLLMSRGRSRLMGRGGGVYQQQCSLSRKEGVCGPVPINYSRQQKLLRWCHLSWYWLQIRVRETSTQPYMCSDSCLQALFWKVRGWIWYSYQGIPFRSQDFVKTV
jgi:hypothetical protein